MQIMFWINKCRYIVVVLFALGAAVNASAEPAIAWVSNKDGSAHLKMSDGSLFDVKLSPHASGVFYDREEHFVGDAMYISLLEAFPSTSVNRLGACGAGSEIWWQIYRVSSSALKLMEKTLVSSCLRSISLSSQNSGAKNQDSDFSSIQWNSKGFSIDWFNQIDAAGQPLIRTDYVLHGDKFLPTEQLINEVRIE